VQVQTLSGMPIERSDALFTFSLSHLVPFFGIGRDAYKDSALALFGSVVLPEVIQGITYMHNVMNAVLIFLLLLAIRNYFRFR
jgi:hypothetical protein